MENTSINNKIIGVIFSRDRAMQLDAVLRSFFLHCQDAGENAIIRVIYKVSDEFHAQQYNQLSRLYPQVQFVEQKNFRQDLFNNIDPYVPRSLKSFLYSVFVGISSIGFPADSRINVVIPRIVDVTKINFIKIFLPRVERYAGVLFLVDDNVFVRNFCLADTIDGLMKNPKAIGFSLRLGKNTQYCYSMRQKQSLPEFISLSENILKYNWTDANLDFAYPLELSSSVYRVDKILPLQMMLAFNSPNSLEAGMAARSRLFSNSYPELLCFSKSVAFCVPVNRVQNTYKNRVGETHRISSEELATMFLNNYRIDVEALSGFTPNSCHQELKLSFIKVE